MGKGPLRTFDRWHLGLVLAGLLALFIVVNLENGTRVSSHQTSPASIPEPLSASRPQGVFPTQRDKREADLGSLKSQINS